MVSRRSPATILLTLLATACGGTPATPTRPAPVSNPPVRTSGNVALTRAWQSQVILDRRDSLVLTLPNGTKQVQRLGRLALFALTMEGNTFTARLDSLVLAPAAPDVARTALGTSWTGRIGAYGRLENLTASKGGILVEELTTAVAALLPSLPRSGARVGETWSDSAKRTIRVEIFRTEERRTSRWRINPTVEREGLLVVPVQIRETFEQVGKGTSSGREMTMTAEGSRSGVYYLTADGRVEQIVTVDSIAKLITIPSAKQSIPTMQYSRTVARFRPLATRPKSD
jgi:hypothetical protein